MDMSASFVRFVSRFLRDNRYLSVRLLRRTGIRYPTEVADPIGKRRLQRIDAA